jgi:hypothetical protein
MCGKTLPRNVQTAATSPQMQRVSDAALCSRESGEFQMSMGKYRLTA